ncbi:MAG: 16S rRNA (cytosine(1402)-N(4))-methyltransferase RsmH [Planctomycetes bacterium]|nr:16S rRNA (cytosine(1402)-N(4))-methyltransferase RsmH [Planctomycetota bacterium]
MSFAARLNGAGWWTIGRDVNRIAGMSEQPYKGKRRKRYPGTHPRRFEERYKELRGDAVMIEHVRGRGRTPAGTHVPVLLREVMSCLRPGLGDVAADCTLGYGGHAMEFLRRIMPGGRLIGLDVDEKELERTAKRLESAGFAGPAVSLHRSNFAGLDKVMAKEGLDGFDIIFADLGVSSMQVDDPSRGVSYKADGPLDMRMDQRLGKTGADLLATLSMTQLSAALRDFSDEPDHHKIAQWIVQQRQAQPIATTDQLARLVLNAKGFSPRARGRQLWQKPGGLHPAARTFQALRILVNDELGCLAQLLRIAPYCLRPGGRVGIISFHSGEDRLVKHAFKQGQSDGQYADISFQVIQTTSQEVRSNPRSASAKFRWARKQ